MSLEKFLQENTAALINLAAVIEAAGLTGVAGSEGGKVEHPVGKSAPTQPAKTPAVKPETALASPSDVLTYADIKTPFLQLVKSNRDAAVGLLKELDVPNLQAFADKPEKFPELLELIEKARA